MSLPSLTQMDIEELVDENPQIYPSLSAMDMDRMLHELGWTRKQLAERWGVHPETVSRWNEPPKSVLRFLRMRVGLQRLVAEAEKLLTDE